MATCQATASDRASEKSTVAARRPPLSIPRRPAANGWHSVTRFRCRHTLARDGQRCGNGEKRVAQGNWTSNAEGLDTKYRCRQPIPTETFTKHIQLLDVDPSNLPANHRSGILSPKTWLLAHTEAKLALLRAGFGFGILPLHMVDRDLASGALVQIRPENVPLCGYAVKISALYRLDGPPGPVGRGLIDHLVQEDGQRLGKSAGVWPFAVKPRSSRGRSPGLKRRN
jgi:DNA-binding transcriptional LysR family regulator